MAMSKVSTSKQAEQARETRRHVIRVARDLFIEYGYGATTLRDIAERADVALQTIYFTFGNKRSLLKELVDTTIAGDDQPIATTDRPWFRDALAAESASAELRQLVQGTRQILERVTPILEILRAAAAIEPETAAFWPQDVNARHAVQAAAATALLAKRGARPGVVAEHVADVLYGLLGSELFLLYVRDCGWTPAEWEQWTYDALRSQLCVD